MHISQNLLRGDTFERDDLLEVSFPKWVTGDLLRVILLCGEDLLWYLDPESDLSGDDTT